MAHDISVYIEKNGRKQEVSYLRIQAFDINAAFFLYNSFDSEDFNLGTSGNGKFKLLNHSEVVKAKSKFNYMITEDEDFIEGEINNFTHESAGRMLDALEEIFGERPVQVNPYTELSIKDKTYIKNKLNHFFDEILMNINEGDQVEILFA